MKAVVSHLKGKKLHELCANGLSKLGSLAVGGGSGAAKVEAKEEGDAKEEEEEEESEDMELGDLFG